MQRGCLEFKEDFLINFWFSCKKGFDFLFIDLLGVYGFWSTKVDIT